MVKQSADPMNAMMLSNEGKIIAMMTNMIMAMIRTVALRSSRVQLLSPMREELSDTTRASRPVSASIVLTIGRAFRGSFVRGITAMKILMSNESALGYPDVSRIFAVISSLTASPNMRIPATAVAASNRYYPKVSDQAIWSSGIRISYCESKRDLDTLGILIGVPHISVDSTQKLVIMFPGGDQYGRWEDTMAAKRR
jgi:hypothetical protein